MYDNHAIADIMLKVASSTIIHDVINLHCHLDTDIRDIIN
jgi:hypothetical protein